MGCCGNTTTTTGAGAAPPDTGKRVNYTKGMLLGVDDFVQEQAWHIARRHELARELLGYGTARGLKVSIDPLTTRVRVSPGMAWMPSGTPVCVGSDQCAGIDPWLDRHWAEVSAGLAGGTTAFDLSLYVVLAYDSALTDLLPVPGEPCRDEAALTAASRVADCFRLELRTRPPVQREEDAVRDFADWIARVPVDEASPPMPEREFLKQLREAASAWLEPTSASPADFLFGSPAPGLASSDGLLRAALRLWVTELRPLWRARYGCGPLPEAPGGVDDAVLLARLDLRVHTADRRADPDPAIAVVEDARPVLLSLRMVQELITQNPAPEPALTVEGPGSFGDDPDTGTSTAYARADHVHGLPDLPALAGDVTGPITGNSLTTLRTRGFAAGVPNTGQVLVVGTGNLWTPATLPMAAGPDQPPVAETLFGLEPQPGSSTAYARADHSHGTPTLQGDVEASKATDDDPPVQSLVVRGLQGQPVSNTAPEKGDVLTFGEFKDDDGLGPRKGWFPSKPGSAVAAATTLPTRVARGSSSVVGVSAAFARADHVHGLDDLPAAGGDARGVLGGLTVVGLQQRAVAAIEPRNGQVLTFNEADKRWEPRAPSGGGTAPVGSFVEREAGAYKLVAAGFVLIEPRAVTSPPVRIVEAYAEMGVTMATSSSPVEMRLDFSAVVAVADFSKPKYIVKLTPVWFDDIDSGAVEFSPYLVRTVQTDGGRIFFQVRLRLSSEPNKGDQFGLQVEVSRYRS